MTTSFEWREHAAEATFVRTEEADFLGQRAGIEALARWAAETFGFDEPGRAAYVAAVVARFVAGADVTDLVLRVRTDLERAGKPALSTHADVVFSRAKAEAASRRPDCGVPPSHDPAPSDVSHGGARIDGTSHTLRRRIV